MKSSRLFLLIVVCLTVALLVSGCATKKFVRQELATSESKLNQKMDQEHAKIGGQISELSALNKQLSSRIEQVSDRAAAAQAKAEEAKTIGTEAKGMAQTANAGVSELRSLFNARNNYILSGTRTVYFDFDKADLTVEAKAILDEVARLIAGNKNMVLTLEGYTDGIGSEQYNIALSEKRVKSVIRYLVADKSVDLNRLYDLGLGKANPIADNKSVEGRKQNRRVTIKMMEVK